MSSPVAGRIADKLGDFIDWTDETLPDEILAEMAKHEKKVPYKYWKLQRGNVARLCLLRQFGGVWIDHDVILLRHPDHTRSWMARDGAYACSAVVCFPQAGDPLLDLALDSITEKYTARDSSGEAMLHTIWPDLPRVPFTFGYEGSEENEPWAVHLWGSRA
jgi:mannosyltransferase OCH1-like enzyme